MTLTLAGLLHRHPRPWSYDTAQGVVRDVHGHPVNSTNEEAEAVLKLLCIAADLVCNPAPSVRQDSVLMRCEERFKQVKEY